MRRDEIACFTDNNITQAPWMSMASVLGELYGASIVTPNTSHSLAYSSRLWFGLMKATMDEDLFK